MKKTWNSDQHSEKVRLFTVCYSIPHYWWTTSLGPSCCLNSLKSKLFLEFISTFTVMARNTSSIKVSEVTPVMEWWFLDGSRCYMFLLSEKLWYLFPSCRPAPPVFAEVRTARALPAVVCHFWDGCISRHFCMVPLIQVYPCIPSHAPLIPLITQPLGVNLHEPWAASCAPRGGCPY